MPDEHKDWFHIILFILYEENAFNNDYVDVWPQVKLIWDKSEDKVNDLNRITTACQRIKDAGFADIDVKYHSIFEKSVIQSKLYLEGLKYVLSTIRQRKIDESLIETNNSVRSLNKWQKVMILLSALTAILTTIFIILTYLQQRNDKNQEQLNTLKKEVQGLRQPIQDIGASLKELNSSIQKIATDTIVVKKHR